MRLTSRTARRSLLAPTAGCVATLIALVLSACAPVDESDDSGAGGTDDAGSPEDTGAAAPACAPGELPLHTDGQLTVATDKPAYPPWFVGNDPTNGQGYESAVAYAVAAELGFGADEVEWVTVPFNASYQPGAKEFDFDINQISITAKRAESVTFSRGYYTAAQAVIVLEGSDYADATEVADLADAAIGAQVGTTSLTAVTDVIQPSEDPAVYDDTNAATNALSNGQVDAVVADLPSAFYITAAQLDDGVIVGQFQPDTGETEEFGLLFEQGNPLVDCVDRALDTLDSDGTLARLENRWLSDVVGVPELS